MRENPSLEEPSDDRVEEDRRVDAVQGAGLPVADLVEHRVGDLVRLCDDEPNGTSANITDRLVRLDPAPGEESVKGERIVETTLPDTAHRFRARHRIRLQVSGGAHPRYARNLSTGEPVGQASRGVPTNHRIRHGGPAPSSITLPLA